MHTSNMLFFSPVTCMLSRISLDTKNNGTELSSPCGFLVRATHSHLSLIFLPVQAVRLLWKLRNQTFICCKHIGQDYIFLKVLNYHIVLLARQRNFITKQHLNKINIFLCLLDKQYLYLPTHKLSLGLDIQPSFSLFVF